MPRRIIVVLSQTPTASPNRRAVEEEFATALIMESGVDVNVIAHVEHLDPGSTGLLCLEGIAGDMIFASWLQPAAAEVALARVGVSGRRGKTMIGDTNNDSEDHTEQASGRRIYYLTMSEHTPVKSLFDEVCRIRDDAQVRTFEIGDILPRAKPAPQPQPTPAAAPPTNTFVPTEEVNEDDAMDKLVDELDAMDL